MPEFKGFEEVVGNITRELCTFSSAEAARVIIAVRKCLLLSPKDNEGFYAVLIVTDGKLGLNTISVVTVV